MYLQDVLEERFRTEYLIAIVVAVGLLLIISLVVTTLLALRCQRSRAKRLRAAAIESSELQRSRSGGDLSNDTVATQVRKVHCIKIRQSTIYYTGLLGQWDKRIVNQESDVPSIFL